MDEDTKAKVSALLDRPAVELTVREAVWLIDSLTDATAEDCAALGLPDLSA